MGRTKAMTASSPSRGLLFGTAAEAYERYRLGYPDEVVDRTLAYVRAPVTRALEIGAGTGKATRAFVSRGVEVVALEPDEGMVGVLRRETRGMSVDVRHSTFEGYDGPRTNLVYAAASWHWTEPASRWARAAELIDDGGALAIFGGPMRLADDEVQDAVAHAVGEDLPDEAFLSSDKRPDPAAADRWPTREMRECGWFEDIQVHDVSRIVTVPVQEYIGYLSTLSAYLVLEPPVRQDVLHRITAVVPDQVRLDLSVGLHLGRRVPR